MTDISLESVLSDLKEAIILEDLEAIKEYVQEADKMDKSGLGLSQLREIAELFQMADDILNSEEAPEEGEEVTRNWPLEFIAHISNRLPDYGIELDDLNLKYDDWERYNEIIYSKEDARAMINDRLNYWIATLRNIKREIKEF